MEQKYIWMIKNCGGLTKPGEYACWQYTGAEFQKRQWFFVFYNSSTANCKIGLITGLKIMDWVSDSKSPLVCDRLTSSQKRQ